MNYNATGNVYALELKDAEAYGAPYEEGFAASAAVAQTMEQVDCLVALKFNRIQLILVQGMYSTTWGRVLTAVHGYRCQ
jgi:hypothetical protein